MKVESIEITDNTFHLLQDSLGTVGREVLFHMEGGIVLKTVMRFETYDPGHIHWNCCGQFWSTVCGYCGKESPLSPPLLPPTINHWNCCFTSWSTNENCGNCGRKPPLVGILVTKEKKDENPE